MDMQISPRRISNLLIFLVCALLLGYAYYLQFYGGLDPCPLCIFQRLAFIALGLVALLAALHHPGRLGGRLYGVLIGLVALGGAGIAARHVWLQQLPPEQVPECGPGLDYMLDVFPLTETIRRVFTGSGECAEVDWTFLGLAMPAWSLIWLLLLGVTGVVVNWHRRSTAVIR